MAWKSRELAKGPGHSWQGLGQLEVSLENHGQPGSRLEIKKNGDRHSSGTSGFSSRQLKLSLRDVA